MSIVFRAGLAGWMLLATAAYGGGTTVDGMIVKEFAQQRERIDTIYGRIAASRRREVWQKAMGDYLEELVARGMVRNYLVTALPASASTSFASSVGADASAYVNTSSYLGNGDDEPIKIVIHYQENNGEPFKTLELKP